MALQFKKAKRSQAKLRIALSSISGGGKTVGALLIAYGLVKAEHPSWSDDEIWGSICIIDTENASGSLYVGSQMGTTKIGQYNSIDLEPPYMPEKYSEAIRLAEENGQECIIIDSMSHSWQYELDKHTALVNKGQNSFTAWALPKKEIKGMMDSLLQSKAHIISCFRVKDAYVTGQNDRGKTTVTHVGLDLVFQDQAEFEYTTHFSIDQSHVASAEKDRTGMFKSMEVITPQFGKMFAEWLQSGAQTVETETKPQIRPAVVPATTVDMETLPNITLQQVDEVIRAAAAAGDKKAVLAKVKEIAGVANYMKVEDPAILAALYNEFKGE